MKRADLKVGESYVLLAPSQRNSTWGFEHGKKVTVVDTEPKWVESYSGGWRDETPKTSHPMSPTGVVKDYTVERTMRGFGAKPTSLVKVMVDEVWTDWANGSKELLHSYKLKVVPLANIAGLWSEHEAEVKDRKARKAAAWKRNEELREQRQQQALAMLDRKRQLEELGLVPEGMSLGYSDGNLVLSGSPEAIEALLLIVCKAERVGQA